MSVSGLIPELSVAVGDIQHLPLSMVTYLSLGHIVFNVNVFIIYMYTWHDEY